MNTLNLISIRTDALTPEVSELELTLNAAIDDTFMDNVFPFLTADSRTCGVRSPQPNGQIQYRFLVYDATIIKTFKQVMYNAMLVDNGQMN